MEGSIKGDIAATPSTVISQLKRLNDETPSQGTNEQLKERRLDFCSAQNISAASSEPKHESLQSASKLLPSMFNSPATKNISQDSSCMIVTETTDNNKITIDKNQLERLLQLTVSKTKAEQRKEQREKKEAEMSVKREAKRRKEEEKLRLQSEKVRNQKLQRENFLKFFTKSSNNKASGSSTTRVDTGWIPTFPIQPGMVVAKLPAPLQDKSKFDDVLKLQDEKFVSPYIVDWKGKERNGRWKAMPCLPPEHEKDDDVIIVDDKEEDKMKMRQMMKYKLLQFHENYRPAYYGTWQKVSTIIRPQNPFKKDETLLDYTVDSDDEWEEEEPGESLSDCHSGDEGEDMEDEDDEDGFFVPHGYLSDGEGEQDDGDTTGQPKENKEEKIKMKEKAWEAEFTHKCQPLKPICIGCCWASNGTETNKTSALMQYQAILFTSLPIRISCAEQEKATSGVKTTPTMDKPISLLTKSCSPQFHKKPVPEEAMPELVKLLHGSSVGLDRAIKRLRVYWGRKVVGDQTEDYSESDYELASGISKRQVEKKIHEVAKKVDRVWQVDKSVLEKYSIAETLSLSSNKLNLYSKFADVSLQNKHSDYSACLLKENLVLNEDKCDVKQEDENWCHSPAKKRLKLTNTQSLVIA